jgi:hypothetical protein
LIFMELPILIALTNFFLFILINGGSPVGDYLQRNYIGFLPEKIRYIFGCQLCFGLWAGLTQYVYHSVVFGADLNPLWIPAFAGVNYLLVDISKE